MKAEKWTVKFLPEALNDLLKLDRSVQKRILAAILKLEKDPIGYGKNLGNKLGLNLSKLYKITPLSGYRIVYSVEETEVLVCIVAVGKREKERVYKNAAKRIEEFRKKAIAELNKIESLLDRK